MTFYLRRPQLVRAIQWTGDNHVEVHAFVDQFIPETGGYVAAFDDPDFQPYDWDDGLTYQFCAWGDDQEADPGSWIVVYQGFTDEWDHEGTIMSDSEFQATYERVST